MKYLSLVLGLCAAVPVQAASLRPMTVLTGAQVYLRDLFDDAGINAGRALGPGPGPGGRIVVEARQLRAIARQFDVDWQPVSNADRAVLEWPGRPMRREDAVAAIRSALVARGVAPDCDIEIPGFTPPMIPASGSAPPVVTQLEHDPEFGRFTAVLSVAIDGADPIAVRASGQAVDVVELPVATVRLPAGAIVGPDDIRMARLHTANVRAGAVRDPRMAVGMQVKRQLPAGAPIAVADLMRPTQISRGEPVSLRLQVGGLSIAGQGIALESGAAGDRIKVRNISSQAVIEAEVLGPGAVRVIPGSVPITAQARTGLTSARGG